MVNLLNYIFAKSTRSLESKGFTKLRLELALVVRCKEPLFLLGCKVPALWLHTKR